MKYQIGNIHDLTPDDPRFATLRAAVEAAEERADGLNERDVIGVWEDDPTGWPELVALAYFGQVYWQDGYTVRMEAQP